MGKRKEARVDSVGEITNIEKIKGRSNYAKRGEPCVGKLKQPKRNVKTAVIHNTEGCAITNVRRTTSLPLASSFLIEAVFYQTPTKFQIGSQNNITPSAWPTILDNTSYN